MGASLPEKICERVILRYWPLKPNQTNSQEIGPTLRTRMIALPEHEKRCWNDFYFFARLEGLWFGTQRLSEICQFIPLVIFAVVSGPTV
jgi:hypothetical protein